MSARYDRTPWTDTTAMVNRALYRRILRHGSTRTLALGSIIPHSWRVVRVVLDSAQDEELKVTITRVE